MTLLCDKQVAAAPFCGLATRRADQQAEAELGGAVSMLRSPARIAPTLEGRAGPLLQF